MTDTVWHYGSATAIAVVAAIAKVASNRQARLVKNTKLVVDEIARTRLDSIDTRLSEHSVSLQQLNTNVMRILAGRGKNYGD